MKPKRHVCTCLTPATHWCPKTGKQYCQQHAEHYASVFGEESLKTFPADKAKPVINKSSELNAANDRIQSLIEERDRANRLAEWKWNLRDEFESLLGTDKIEEGIEAVKELKRRIQRLEEAGDALYENSYPTRWDLPEANARKMKEQEEWRKAKEAKP